MSGQAWPVEATSMEMTSIAAAHQAAVTRTADRTTASVTWDELKCNAVHKNDTSRPAAFTKSSQTRLSQK
jgi:hypothetical protein